MNQNSFVDLSGIPRMANGNFNWEQSVGTVLSFTYNDIVGEIKILEYVRIKPLKLKILIKTTDMEKEYLIRPASLKKCALRYALLKPVGETHPHLINFFVNENDAFIYSANSGVSVQLICPACRTKKFQRLEDFVELGFSCPVCGDGTSYPEKFLFNILVQLGIDFKSQVNRATPGFEWIDGRYRYDFYIEHNEQKFFIELDGRFHNHDVDCMNNDKHKNTMAYAHNIKIIRIDCDYNSFKERFNFIKSNIQQSELSKIIPMHLVNWEDAHEKALQSKIVIASQLWEHDKLCLCEIANIVGVSQNTVREYLKIGTNLHLCNYNNDEVKRRNVDKFGKIALKGSKKQIALFKDGVLVGVFFCASELEDVSDQKYGIHFNANSIASTCIGRRNHYFGYTMKYISYEEYEQLLPRFSNNTKLIEI